MKHHWLFDRLVATVACLPFIAGAAAHIREGTFDIPRIALLLQILLQVVPMFVRRAPQRVTTNLWYWLLAFLATYWPFIAIGWITAGRPLVSPLITDALSLISLAGAAWARLSLGRNIGFVPAQRELVTRGAYRYVRHPIYTSVFVSYLAFVASCFTPLNAVQALLGCFWFIVKSVVEERFLAADPVYHNYMQKVRWRWIPLIA